VIRCRDIPAGVTAVLTGHVHRHQVLTTDLDRKPLAAPVIYPGSTERTAFAEKDEAKGVVLIEARADPPGSRASVRWRFERLPARPMVVSRIQGDGVDVAELSERVRAAIGRAPTDAVLRLRIEGQVPDPAREVLSAATLRTMAPASMNVEVDLADEGRGWSRRPQVMASTSSSSSTSGRRSSVR
jgi:DNA repair exonuclease SbcCD nuclease subunit